MPAPENCLYATHVFRAPLWERNPRQGLLQPKFLCHRYPIKGGLSLRDVWSEMLTTPNPLIHIAEV